MGLLDWGILIVFLGLTFKYVKRYWMFYIYTSVLMHLLWAFEVPVDDSLFLSLLFAGLIEFKVVRAMEKDRER